jgi:dipeptide transport system ATP-binding protein
MIAMALACRPKLLIADEPTTALDVTIQAQILDLLLSLQRETGMGLVLITHNMGVVAETAQRVSCSMPASRSNAKTCAGSFAKPTTLHGGSSGRPARSCAGRPASRHPRRRAWAGGSADGLPVQPALRLRHELCVRVTPPVQSTALGQALCHYPRHSREIAA